uniref:Lipoyl-binding domain-containing protein n=1 Tax=Tetradesmus obliquus TaxID=3088 RepID=A0A383V4A1_TETOB|eukprot:jgi/Sobl393_1/3953/SZX60447.1
MQALAVKAKHAISLLQLSKAWYSVQIVVPSLGESITDGTIATLLKGAGDSVKENETIALIETDKVTIDIKAPSDGTILGVVVQEQETVVPGQLVATLDDAAAKASLIGGTPAASQPAPAAAAPAPPAAPAGHRIAGIRFPPRMTADGRRISALPAAEASAILQAMQPGAAAPAAAAAAAPAAAQSSKPAAATGAFMTKPAAPAAAAGVSSAAPGKFSSSVLQLERMPQRRELTEKEMELIELGGALP